MNQKNCRSCIHLEFNEMTDEMYCKLNDYELIWIKWRKRRPDWCPLVTGQKGGKNERRITTGMSDEAKKGRTDG